MTDTTHEPVVCESTYTIDFRTGEKLECNGKHVWGRERHPKHSATYLGIIWYWSPEEEDK